MKRLLRIVTLITVFTLMICMMAMAAPNRNKGGRPLGTVLVGNQEVPDPGDPDGSGGVMLWLHTGRGEIRYEISVQLIEPATAAHIHVGVVGEPGPVVVTLEPPTDGSSSGIVSVSKELIQEIKRNPDLFYVNVHNAEYPGGAIRGQLSK